MAIEDDKADSGFCMRRLVWEGQRMKFEEERFVCSLFSRNKFVETLNCVDLGTLDYVECALKDGGVRKFPIYSRRMLNENFRY
jgi:hypothetical protein